MGCGVPRWNTFWYRSHTMQFLTKLLNDLKIGLLTYAWDTILSLQEDRKDILKMPDIAKNNSSFPPASRSHLTYYQSEPAA